MGFHLEAVVTQSAGQGKAVNLVNGFDIRAGIGFGRVGKFVGMDKIHIFLVFRLFFIGLIYFFFGIFRIFLLTGDLKFAVQKRLRFDFLMAVVNTVFQQGLFGKAAVEVEVRTMSGDSGMVRTFYIACVTAAAVIGGLAFVFQHIGVGVQFFDKAKVLARVL